MSDSSVCRGCGAMLPLPDLAGLATCPSCGRVARSEPTVPSATPPAEDLGSERLVAAGGPSGGAGTAAREPSPEHLAALAAAGVPLRPPPDRSSRSTRGPGCLVGAFAALLLFVAGVAVFAFSSARDDLRERIDPDTAYDGLFVLGGSAQLLAIDGGPAGAAEVLATVQENVDGGLVRRLARIRFTGGASELVWQSEPVDDGAYRAAVAVSGDTLFVGIDREVAALDLASGDTRWRAELRDDVTTGCADCFAVVGGRLVVRTTDAYLTGFGPSSAEQQWSRRLRSPAASVSVAGDRLLVVDAPEVAGDPVAAVVVDPATGRDVQATAPSCPPDDRRPSEQRLSVGDEVHAVPDSDDVVAAFGFGDGCVARWSPDDGTVRWASSVGGVSSVEDESVVIDGTTMAFASTGGTAAAVDLATGAVQVLELPPDAAAVPRLVADGTLLGDTVSTRGSRRGGVAGWDPATGELRWTAAVPGDAEPVEPDRYASTVALFDGSPRSVLAPTSDGASIVVFDGGARTYSVTPVAVGSGRLGTELRRDLLAPNETGIPSLAVVGVDGDRLVVAIDSLVEVIPTVGAGEAIAFPPTR
ncbi:MAG: PQQ-like beta-propeller repeat protein [Acidimicrobiales bacterium]|nr:PQQ-like beta-propeller repeat protein [Acidimicrobiales bacterium]